MRRLIVFGAPVRVRHRVAEALHVGDRHLKHPPGFVGPGDPHEGDEGQDVAAVGRAACGRESRAAPRARRFRRPRGRTAPPWFAPPASHCRRAGAAARGARRRGDGQVIGGGGLAWRGLIGRAGDAGVWRAAAPVGRPSPSTPPQPVPKGYHEPAISCKITSFICMKQDPGMSGNGARRPAGTHV